MSTIYFMYRIFNPDYTECYIGSTANFNSRRSNHKQRCKNHPYKIYEFIRNNGGWDKWNMEPLEIFSCDTKEEKLEREKELIKVHNDVLNTISPLALNVNERYATDIKYKK